jgi:hypothetical protein
MKQFSNYLTVLFVLMLMVSSVARCGKGEELFQKIMRANQSNDDGLSLREIVYNKTILYCMCRTGVGAKKDINKAADIFVSMHKNDELRHLSPETRKLVVESFCKMVYKDWL